MPLQNVHFIEADIKEKKIMEEPRVVANDDIAFIVSITDNGNSIDTSLVTQTVLASVRPDRKTVITPGVLLEDGTVKFELGHTETQKSGQVKATAQLFDSEGDRISSVAFSYHVERDPTGEDYIPTEKDKTFIEVVLVDGPSIIQEAKDVTASAQQSVTEADSATVRANTAADGAEVAAETAESKANLAQGAANAATTATTAAELATSSANDAASTANDAASTANNAASSANTAASSANAQAGAAQQAATDATTASTAANSSADRANTAAGNAEGIVEEFGTYKDSEAKAKTFGTVDERFEELEVDSYYPSKNLIFNGNFNLDNDGNSIADGFSTAGNTVTTTLSNNIQRVIKGSTESFWGINYSYIPRLQFISGHKYFFSVSMGVPEKSNEILRLRFRTAFGTAQFEGGTDSYFEDNLAQFKPRTVIKTCTVSGDAQHYITGHTAANELGADAPLDIGYVSVIDLSATFGVGNEPTKEQMEALLASYPSSWFDGAVNLAENKKLLTFLLKQLRGKANKSQESWVTPTLLNGATNYATNVAPVRFYKDEFGIVHLDGISTAVSIGTTLFILPEGYRPSKRIYIPSVFGNAFGWLEIMTSGIVKPGNQTNPNIFIAYGGITFKAEL